jgi:hypothetical protein
MARAPVRGLFCLFHSSAFLWFVWKPCMPLTQAVVSCPAGAMGLPCACATGFAGSLQWSASTQSYTGTCSGKWC